MGLVYEDFTLKNEGDVINARRGQMKTRDIRQLVVEALVDTGSGTLVINEDTRKKLGLEVVGLRRAALANNEKKDYKAAESVEIHWHNRSMVCQPLVASEDGDILMGAIPLEDMDLIVDTARQRLTGAHGDEVVCMMA